MAATLEKVVEQIQQIQHDARTRGDATRPRWPMIVLKSPKGWTGPKMVDGLRVEGTFRAHQVPLSVSSTAPSQASQAARELVAELQAGGTLRRARPPQSRTGRTRAERRATDGRESARQRRNAAARPAHAGLPRLRGRRSLAGRRDGRRHARAGPIPSRRDQAERGNSGISGSSVPTRRSPIAWKPSSKSPIASGTPQTAKNDQFLAPTGRRDGGAQRTPMRGLAGGIPAHRAARAVQQLRGVHPHRRFDVQPARQVAEDVVGTAVAAEDRVAELPAVLHRLAAGPQRLHAPGPRLHRPRRQQEGRDRPRLPPAGRQLSAVGHGSLPAQPALRQRGGCGQAPGPAVADDGRRGRALRGRDRHLAMGEQRPDRRAGRGDGLLPATCPRSRRWRPFPSSASICPI